MSKPPDDACGSTLARMLIAEGACSGGYLSRGASLQWNVAGEYVKNRGLLGQYADTRQPASLGNGHFTGRTTARHCAQDNNTGLADQY